MGFKWSQYDRTLGVGLLGASFAGGRFYLLLPKQVFFINLVLQHRLVLILGCNMAVRDAGAASNSSVIANHLNA